MAAAMIPSMMLVLGSVLHKGPGSARVPKRVILGILAVRQIVIPLLGELSIMHRMSCTGNHLLIIMHRGVSIWHDALFLIIQESVQQQRVGHCFG